VTVPYWHITTHGDGIAGGLLQRPAPVPAGGAGTNAFTCSVQVADFDASAQKVLDAGGVVALPKFAVPGKCWQGYFLDTEGNTFGLFQADDTAA
jgi:predicted enzyme related to lactoylglutathione lyase